MHPEMGFCLRDKEECVWFLFQIRKQSYVLEAHTISMSPSILGKDLAKQLSPQLIDAPIPIL